MRLRALRSFLLPILFAIALTPAPAYAQSPRDAELDALYSRISALYRAGKYDEAVPLAEQYVATAKMRYGENAPLYAVGLSWLSRLHQRIQLSELEDLNKLAQLLQANRLAEAEPLLRRDLAIHERSFGPDHPFVADGLNKLAEALRAANRHSEAEPLLRRALAIDEKAFGPGHPKVARDLNNLAQALQAMNRSSEAEPLMRRALTIGK